MIVRTLALLGFAAVLALALVAPLGNEADARSHYGLKRCIGPAAYGAPITWVCKAAETCCYDFVLRRGSCPTRRCF
jgi:hypothetical protein